MNMRKKKRVDGTGEKCFANFDAGCTEKFYGTMIELTHRILLRKNSRNSLWYLSTGKSRSSVRRQ